MTLCALHWACPPSVVGKVYLPVMYRCGVLTSRISQCEGGYLFHLYLTAVTCNRSCSMEYGVDSRSSTQEFF